MIRKKWEFAKALYTVVPLFAPSTTLVALVLQSLTKKKIPALSEAISHYQRLKMSVSDPPLHEVKIASHEVSGPVEFHGTAEMPLLDIAVAHYGEPRFEPTRGAPNGEEPEVIFATPEVGLAMAPEKQWVGDLASHFAIALLRVHGAIISGVADKWKMEERKETEREERKQRTWFGLARSERSAWSERYLAALRQRAIELLDSPVNDPGVLRESAASLMAAIRERLIESDYQRYDMNRLSLCVLELLYKHLCDDGDLIEEVESLTSSYYRALDKRCRAALGKPKYPLNLFYAVPEVSRISSARANDGVLELQVSVAAEEAVPLRLDLAYIAGFFREAYTKSEVEVKYRFHSDA